MGRKQLDGDEDVVDAGIVKHFVGFSRDILHKWTNNEKGGRSSVLFTQLWWLSAGRNTEKVLPRWLYLELKKKRGKPQKKGRKAWLTVSWSNATVYLHHGYTKHTSVGINLAQIMEFPMHKTRHSDEHSEGRHKSDDVNETWSYLCGDASLPWAKIPRLTVCRLPFRHSRGGCHRDRGRERCPCDLGVSFVRILTRNLKEFKFVFFGSLALPFACHQHPSSTSFCLASDSLPLKPSSLTSPLSLR